MKQYAKNFSVCSYFLMTFVFSKHSLAFNALVNVFLKILLMWYL